MTPHTVWAWHPTTRRWIAIRHGLHPNLARDEMVTRQDRVRRTGHPTTFAVRPDRDGPPPDP